MTTPTPMFQCGAAHSDAPLVTVEVVDHTGKLVCAFKAQFVVLKPGEATEYELFRKWSVRIIKAEESL